MLKFFMSAVQPKTQVNLFFGYLRFFWETWELYFSYIPFGQNASLR